MDIEGAFDSTSNKAISEAMNSHGVPAEWTKNMLTSRKLTVSYEGKILENRPIGGCLQGDVLSPTLWCLVVDDLLRLLEEEGFQVYDG